MTLLRVKDDEGIRLIELQGTIEANTDDLTNLPLGEFSLKNNIPTLKVGNHLLTGKIVPLKKPLAVLDGDEIIQILVEKYLFTQRPKIIFS